MSLIGARMGARTEIPVESTLKPIVRRRER